MTVGKDIRFEPPSKEPLIDGDRPQFSKEVVVIDVVEASGYIRVEHILRLSADVVEDGHDRIMRRTAWSEPITVRLELGLPFGFQPQFHQGLQGSVAHRGDAERPCLAVGFGDVDSSDGIRFRRVFTQMLSQSPLLIGLKVLSSINPGSAFASVIERDSADRQESGQPGPLHETLEIANLLPVSTACGSVDALLKPEHLALDFLPVDGSPVFRMSL